MAKNTEKLVAKVVRSIQANERMAGAKTKKRGEVSGGGKKPWRQKGTGRARVGSNRSPIWRGGGVVFGPTGVENYKLNVNKKEKEIAKKAVLESKKSDIVSLGTPVLKKTKEAAEFLKKNDLSGKVLILVKESGTKESDALKTLKRVFANIPEVKVLKEGNESVIDLLSAKKIAVLGEKKEAPKAKTTETAKPVQKTEKKEAAK